MHLTGSILSSLLVLCLPYPGTCKDTYDIPVTFNPLKQESVKLAGASKFFYDRDPDFFSKVKVIDAAWNAEERVRDTIKKSIGVVLLTVASSHITKSLKLKNATKSKWSYTLNVNSILKASKGELKNLDDATLIYKIQENAIKVLEKRYDFKSDEILQKLNISKMEFYAVGEEKWICVVRIIVEKIISRRTKALNLTRCYLADMVNKTEEEMQGFTLNDVDTYIYHTSTLLSNLSHYRASVLSRLYQTFDMMSTDLVNISGTDKSVINKMKLHDVLKLFSESVLKVLGVTKDQVLQSDSKFETELLLSCTDKWEPFKRITIPASFNNSAKAMKISAETLAALIETPHSNIKSLTITKMKILLEENIEPLSKDKELLETKLYDVLNLLGLDTINENVDNVLGVIYRITTFSSNQLSILYGWIAKDYMFSSMFTFKEINNVCGINSQEYDLVTLANLAVGGVEVLNCTSFQALRELWKKKSWTYLENRFSRGNQLPSNMPISTIISQLIKAPSTVTNRLLNMTSEAESLIRKISINNITAVTTYSSSSLKSMSFQDVINIIVHLKRNGSFDSKIQVTSLVASNKLSSIVPSIPTSTIFSSAGKFLTSDASPSTLKESTKPVLSTEKAIKSKPLKTLKTLSPSKSTTVSKSRTNVQPYPTVEVETPYLHTSTMSRKIFNTPTPPITSKPTLQSIIDEDNNTHSYKITTSKAATSSIQNPVAKHLEGRFRIISGASFTDDLLDKRTNTFRELSNEIETMIDDLYQHSQYSSAYLGVQVIKYEQGSVVVFFKISFQYALALPTETIELITKVFKDKFRGQFTIDNSSIVFQDFDECSSGQKLKCHQKARCNNTLGSYSCICQNGMTGNGIDCQVNRETRTEKDVPWIIYVVIAIMVLLIIFLIVVIIYCEKKHKKRHRPQTLDFYNGGINMYPRSTSYLAQTPECEADLADKLGIVNRHDPPPNMITFNPTPEERKELKIQNGQPGVFHYRL